MVEDKCDQYGRGVFRLPRENLAIVVRVQDSKNTMSLVVPHPSSESNSALVSTSLFQAKIIFN